MAFAPMGHIAGDELERRLLRHMLQSGTKDPLLIGTEDPGKWFSNVELACAQCAVPPSQYTDAALILIDTTSPLLRVMQEHRRTYLERTHEAFWPWHMSKVVFEAEVHRLNEVITLKEILVVTGVSAVGLSLLVGETVAAGIATTIFWLLLIGKAIQAFFPKGTAPLQIQENAQPALAVDADEAPQHEEGWYVRQWMRR